MSLIPLPEGFYESSAREVAPRLLGHWLVRLGPAGPTGGPIVETEAYLEGDPACHAFKGRTARNGVMWGPPGRAYVYFIYGMHYCVNAVCLREGRAEAVLIRAIEPQFGLANMKISRGLDVNDGLLTNGPARICQALGITGEFDGFDLTQADSGLFIARNARNAEFVRERGPVRTSARIGISVAADKPLRYYLAGSPHVSRKAPRTNVTR